MNKLKRFLSALFALLMVIGLIPLSSITVSAATTISLNRPLDKAYTITAREYYSSESYHGAIDYGCPKGTPVYAAESGTITVYDGGYGDGYYGSTDGSGWGNYADISHGNGWYTRYAHMSTGRFVVSSGSYVERGQLIGYSGNSGNSTGAHLHFGLYLNGLKSDNKVYPESYITTSTGYFIGESPTTHTVDSSYATNIEAYPKEKITAGNIFDANHNQISSTGWIGTSDLCTIHEVYTDGCCKVTYPLDNGGTKTVYSKISLFRASVPSIKYWVSSTEYGSEVSEGTAGNRYYLCYYLFDKISKKDWDEVVSSDYEVRLTIYNPDGSVKYTNENKFDYDRGWISDVFGEDGTYKVGFSVSGNWSGSATKSFTVKANPIKVNCSTNSVSLKLGETESKTIYVGYSGYYDGNWILNYQRSNSNVSCTWGEWTDDLRSPLTIQANAMGSTTVTISVKDKDTGAILDSKTVTVTVGAKAYTVSYNANGGSGAPSSQTKYHNTTLALSSTKPTRTGYTFLGWSTSSTATSATYQPGGSFTSNANTTLYAIWKLNTTALSANTSNSAVISTGGEMKYFTFTPSTSGKYVIYSTGSDDTKVYLYNANWTELDSDDDGGDGNNFRLEYSLTAGTKYILGIKYHNSSKTGTIPFKFGNVYTVTYNANGGTGAPSAQSKDYGTNITLSSTVPMRTGYTFLGWSTISTATSAAFQAGSSFSNNANRTLYAVWKANTYTISYDANGGNGELSNQTKTYGVNLTLSSTVPTRTGYTFLGWSTTSTATSATYQPGGTFTGNANTMLYAVWKQGCENETHNYSYTVTIEPTTSTTGTLTSTCSQCSGTTTVTLPALNATDYTSFVRVVATCTKEGLIRYTWVMENNDSFYFDVSIPATGHDMQQTAAEVAPTCETAGKTAVLTCANFLCSKTEGGEEIPAIGHSYENNVCTACGHKIFAAGDIDGENGVTYNDAVYLLLHTLFGEEHFPLTCAQGDIDRNGVAERADAVYLLLHVLFGAEFYPLKN